MTKRLVYPFSNGTQFMDWSGRNCDRCVKRCRDDLAIQGPCEIQNAIFLSQIESGGFAPAMAKRMGYTEGAYTWKCPEFDDVPGSCCGHCLKPIETEDELIISERCGKCGGSLSAAGSVLDKVDMEMRRLRDDEAERAAIACGLIVPRTGEAAPPARGRGGEAR